MSNRLPMRPSRGTRLTVLIAIAVAACRDDIADAPRASTASVPVVAFDSLFRPIERLQLRPSDDDPIGSVAALDVHGSRAVLSDVIQGNVKVFDLKTGALVRTLGRPGDGPGEFRRPSSMARTSAGELVILDFQRRALSWWDTAGRFQREQVVAGRWAGMSGLAGTDRLLLLGSSSAPGDPETRTGTGATEFTALHELDSEGQIAKSYRVVARPTSSRERIFQTITAAALGSVIVSGSYNTNVVYFRNLDSGREWTAAIAAPWYRYPDWEAKLPPGNSGTDALQKWVRQQMLAYELYSIDQSTFLAQFQSYDEAGGRLWNYVVADTVGVSHISTLPSPVQLLRVSGDTAWGLEPDAESGDVTLATFLLIRPASISSR